MRFDYDPNKAASNIRRHKVSFADAEAVFEDPLALNRSDPNTEGEERFVAIGLGAAGELLVAVYTLRGATIGLISVRRATRREAKEYAG